MKELLTLSRKIKELWVFGPLGREDPNWKTKDEQIERDVKSVGEMLNSLEEGRMKSLVNGLGGKWETLKEETTSQQ